MVIAYVGAGGKTTQLKEAAARFRQTGKTVFVTTSTHMFIEEDTLLSDDPREIIRQLEQTGYAMAGVAEGEKITALSPATYAAVCERADVVLVEADGSKHLPLKFPAEGEPVIPANADEIVIVCGLHALGKPLCTAAHRSELARRCLGVADNTPVTAAHIQTLVIEGYVRPLRKAFPLAHITVSPAHDGTPVQRAISERIVAETAKYL